MSILDIGKKIFNADGTFDEVASLKVSLPFWLYLHLSFACKLFIDAGLKVQFLLLLIGKTGNLKTTICETFAEPFNEGSILRFESTSALSGVLTPQQVQERHLVEMLVLSKDAMERAIEKFLQEE